MKGRKPTPTHLRIVRGNPGKRAINRHEPQSTPISATPPPELTPEQQMIWSEVVRAAPPHVLKVADSLIVELVSRLVWRLRSDPDVQVGVAAQLKGCLAELGMTPTSRARLSVGPPKPTNPFEAV